MTIKEFWYRIGIFLLLGSFLLFAADHFLGLIPEAWIDSEEFSNLRVACFLYGVVFVIFCQLIAEVIGFVWSKIKNRKSKNVSQE